MTFKEFFKGDRFAVLAGCELLEVGNGTARARMLVTRDHLNPCSRLPTWPLLRL